LKFLVKKRYKKNFSSVFGHQNPGSGLGPDPDSLEMLDPDPDPDPDPQHGVLTTRNSLSETGRDLYRYGTYRVRY
jgi:hypothetical protein